MAYKMRVKHLVNDLFLAYSDDGRILIIDARKDRKYFAPMELMLISSAACTAIDVLSILKKMRKNVNELTVEVEGWRRDKPPRIYESINLAYMITGEDISMSDAKKAINLSLSKYCSATITLERAGAKISYNIKLY